MKAAKKEIILKPTKEAEELATHELPILRSKLKELNAQRRIVLEKILFHEEVIGKRNNVEYSVPELDSIYLETEYATKKTYAEKILFITEHPYLYGREVIEGKSDIVEIIYSQEKDLPFTDCKKLLKKLNNSIPSILSRLYQDRKILKYRYNGTKAKFLTINPSWLSDGIFKEEFSAVTKNIELVRYEEASVTEAS